MRWAKSSDWSGARPIVRVDQWGRSASGRGAAKRNAWKAAAPGECLEPETVVGTRSFIYQILT